jgi:putative transposase
VLKPTPTRLAQTFSERSEDPLVFSLLHCHQGAPRVWRAPIRQADRVQPHALAEAVRTRILAWLSEERFADCSVQQTLWRVIDEVCCVASLRTWYRVAARHRLCGDRRRHPSRPATVIPQLCAAGPNQVWSWDIARVKIKAQKTPLHPYLIEDVFSRKCVGWRLEEREHDRLAADLIQTRGEQ